jgi:hypothetical protein
LKGQTDSPTERENLLFFCGVSGKVIFVADEDDEVRTTVKPQSHMAESK